MSIAPRFLLPALLCMSAFTGLQSQAQARGGSQLAEAPVEIARAIDPDALRLELAKRRTEHLAQLLAYANAGEFPINRVSDGPLNVFIDEDGHVCAAANLISLDGLGALVKKTAASNNYIVLAEVKSGPLMDWMLTSGFTQEEIAQIQEPYMPIEGEGADLDQPLALGPAPHFAAPPLTAAEERARVQGVLRGVHQTLSANSNKSIYLATQRLQANAKLATTFLVQPRSAPRFAR